MIRWLIGLGIALACGGWLIGAGTNAVPLVAIHSYTVIDGFVPMFHFVVF